MSRLITYFTIDVHVNPGLQFIPLVKQEQITSCDSRIKYIVPLLGVFLPHSQ